jgi:hypothetical protein
MGVMKENLLELLGELNNAIREALCNSQDVLTAVAAIEEASGNVRISIDVLLPGATDLERPSFPGKNIEYDVQFLRSMKIEP